MARPYSYRLSKATSYQKLSVSEGITPVFNSAVDASDALKLGTEIDL